MKRYTETVTAENFCEFRHDLKCIGVDCEIIADEGLGLYGHQSRDDGFSRQAYTDNMSRETRKP